MVRRDDSAIKAVNVQQEWEKVMMLLSVEGCALGVVDSTIQIGKNEFFMAIVL